MEILIDLSPEPRDTAGWATSKGEINRKKMGESSFCVLAGRCCGDESSVVLTVECYVV